MTGYLRFFLAAIVAHFHVSGTVFGIGLGMQAVMFFYILSGAVVAGLLSGPFLELPIWKFFAERAIRIYPTYFFILILTALFVIATGFGNPRFTPVNIIANILVVPLNYYFIPDFIVLTEKFFWLVPTAWSLGLELQAYVLLAFALRASPLIRLILGGISLLVFAAAGSRMINTDLWSYKLLPGTFYLFLVGACLGTKIPAEGIFGKLERYFPILAWVFVAAVALRCHFTEKYEIWMPASGFLLGLPVVAAVLKYKKHWPWNGLLGSLSYGVFLAHVMVMWFFEWLAPGLMAGFLRFPLVLLFSVLISFIPVYFIEAPLWQFRKSLSIKEKTGAGVI